MRKFTPTEFNHLQKFKIDPYSISEEDQRPVEYISGFAGFRGEIFKVNENVLIPRIETEEIVELALKEVQSFYDPLNQKVTTFTDIGTGSGCIGISFAKELLKRKLNFQGFLSDISEKALEIAQKNLNKIIGDSDRIEILKSNLFDSYGDGLKFDIIFANLPYIPSKNIPTLQNSVKDFEPHLALDGGEDGLKLIRDLLNQAKTFLKPTGVILLEVDDSHIDASEFTGEWNVEVLKDSLGSNRFWRVTFKF